MCSLNELVCKFGKRQWLYEPIQCLSAPPRMGLEAFTASQWKLKTSAILMLFTDMILIWKPDVWMNLIYFIFSLFSKWLALFTVIRNHSNQLTVSDHQCTKGATPPLAVQPEEWGPKGIFLSDSDSKVGFLEQHMKEVVPMWPTKHELGNQRNSPLGKKNIQGQNSMEYMEEWALVYEQRVPENHWSLVLAKLEIFSQEQIYWL